MKPLPILALLATLTFAPPLEARLNHAIVGHASLAESSPVGPTVNSGGFLYFASRDGDTSHGAIHRFSPATGAFEPVHTFAGAAGGSSPNGVVEGSDGHLYGVTGAGGSNGAGLIFRLTKAGVLTVLHHFVTASGGTPYGTPVQGSDGHLYGIVGFGGGPSNHGGIYRYDLATSSYTLLRSFTGTAGDTPGRGTQAGGLTEGPDGRLYGTTRYGGENGTGVLFALNRATGDYSVIHMFGTSGLIHPSIRLLAGSDGYLYGATSVDGPEGQNSIYRIATNGSGLRILHRFDSSAGGLDLQNPLVEGRDGYLYGVSYSSPSEWGSLFRMRKDGRSFVLLHRFDAGEKDGQHPTSPLLEVSPGTFYGITYRGGNIGWGSVYRLETTLEGPVVKIPTAVRKRFKGNQVRLKGTATDDLAVVRVEYSSGKGWKKATGTTSWRGQVRVKRSVKTAKVRIRATDNDALVSKITTIRPRRSR